MSTDERAPGDPADVHLILTLDHQQQIYQKHTDHDTGGSIGERSVADVSVSSDPADVGRAPEHVVRLVVEHVLERRRRIQQVAGLCVKHALRLPRRTTACHNITLHPLLPVYELLRHVKQCIT